MRLAGFAAGAISGAAIASLAIGTPMAVVLLGALAGGAICAALAPDRWLGDVDTIEKFAPLALVAFFVPALTLPVAPGADMSMHAALARGLLDGILSPAWPSVRVPIYPRGMAALIALLSPFGIARASLLASGTSFVIFWAGLSSVLARLRTPRARSVAVLFMFLSREPQIFFAWGGDATALGLGLSLLAASSIEKRGGPLSAMLFAGAAATHPMGALAGGLVAAVVAVWKRTWTAALIGAAGLGLMLGLLARYGPQFSPREIAWIHDYALREDVPLRKMGAEMGDPAAIATALAALALLVRRQARPVLAAAAAIAAMALLILVLPRAGLYPVRFLPLLSVPMAALWGRAAWRWPWLLGAAMLAALPGHIRWYQRAVPNASVRDLSAIACAAEIAPKKDVIDGAYGDGTSWIPALIGRAVTRPHVHVSLFDETDAALAAQPAPKWRFVGERLRYPPAIPPPPRDWPSSCDGALYKIQ